MHTALYQFITILSLLTAAVLIVLYTRLKTRSKNLRKILETEYASMAEPLAKVAFGMLKQEMTHGGIGEEWAKEYLKGLDAVKNNFNKITGEPLQRLCYVGTDAWMEGIACARHIGERLKKGGTVAILVTSNLHALIMAQRSRSFAATIAREFPLITLLTTFEANANQDNARNFVIKNADKLDALYVTGNSAVPGVAQGIKEAGATGKIHVLCHDVDAVISENIRKGYISASLICSTYAQGRDSVIHLFNHLASNWKPIQPRIMLDLKTVDNRNLSDYWDDDAKEPRRSSSINDTGLSAPERSEKPIRILVFCEDWNNAFKQMNIGVEMANVMLRGMNAEIVVHVLNQVKRPVAEVISEAETVIQREKAKGLSGVTTFVGIAEMVPVLNKLTAAGISVTTYNSEPLGLRSMILWLMQGSEQLGRFTDEYKSGHSEIDQALREVLSSIQTMVTRIGQEARSVSDGAKAIDTLTTLIDRTSEAEAAQSETIRASADISNKLSEMVNFFEGRVQGLKDMGLQVRRSSEKTIAMDTYSKKIESIIGIIDGIAEQTNLLAFNAAVEATHAGEYGKGFKVISQEIRALADLSVQSTGNIAQLINDMRTAITEGITANTRTQEIVEEQVSSISTATSRLGVLAQELLDAMRTVRETVERNSAAISGMRDSARSVNEVMAETTNISIDNSGTIETISSTFTEISAQFSEMNKQTSQLAELVTMLEGTVSSFS